MTPTEPLIEAIVAGVVERLRANGVLAYQKRSRLMGIDEAADYLGRTPKAVRKLIEAGKLPVVRLDGRVQLDMRDLDRTIEGAKETAH